MSILKSDIFMENRDLRDNCSDKIDVLETIKPLTTLPQMECMTFNQIADYFETTELALKNCYHRHMNEIDDEGVTYKFPRDFKDLFENTKQMSGKMEVELSEGFILTVPNRGLKTFSKRSVLRFGMLLDDSEIAKELRNRLLEFIPKTEDGEGEINQADENVKDESISAEQVKDTYDIQMFNNEEFGSVRAMIINDEPWFVGKDVAGILGYKETAKAIRTHIDDEDKGVSVLDTPGGKQNITIINESGLYSLILSSKLPAAKQFKRWVTNDILPNIRKHGAYMTPETLEKALTDPDFIIKLATSLKEEQEKSKCLQSKNDSLTNVNKLLTKETLLWTSRSNINAIVRKLASSLHMNFAVLWNLLYKELQYRHSISVKSRAKIHEQRTGKRKQLLDFVKDNEWCKLEATIAAICESNGIDAESFFAEATNQVVKSTL